MRNGISCTAAVQLQNLQLILSILGRFMNVRRELVLGTQIPSGWKFSFETSYLWPLLLEHIRVTWGQKSKTTIFGVRNELIETSL